MILDVEFAESESVLDISFGEVQKIDVPGYDGPHEVTPSDTGTILPTAHKQLSEDVTVHPIPYFCVSNPAGGDTVYIGGGSGNKLRKDK